MDELKEHDYVGVDTRPDPLRTYPAGDVAANLIGYLGDDPSKVSGGLERSFNKLLAGKDGKETYEVGGGNRIPLGDNSQVKPVNGKDLRLTIDRDVQWYSPARAAHGRAVVEGAVRRRRGARLPHRRDPGARRLPDLRPQQARQGPKKQDLGSRALSDVYEPGSVEKVLTAPSLLDAGKVTPRTRIHGARPSSRCSTASSATGSTTAPIRLTMAGVIARSPPTSARRWRRRSSTPEQLCDYLDKFGLGQRTDVGHARRDPRPAAAGDIWSTLTRAQVAFGQGLSVNALQMATAVNTVANGGELITPEPGQRAGHHQRRQRGRHRDHHEAQRVVSADAARKTAEMMELVTTPDVGTAPGAGIEGYRVAGKTGTAQEVGGACNCYRTAAWPSPSPGSRRPTSRASPSTSWSSTPARARAAAAPPARCSARSWPTSCRSTPWRRPAPRRRTIPIQWGRDAREPTG